MGLYDSSSATTTSLTTTLTATSITEKDTEISIYYPEWTKWHGYYRENGRLQAIIDKVAVWTAGKGIKAKNTSDQETLDKIRGNGKDTIRDIVINQIRTADICGDSFAEIILDANNKLKNLKPISPGSMAVVADQYGIIFEYQQVNTKVAGKPPEKYQVLQKWKPEQILHLQRMRIADSISGIGVIEKIEDIVLKKKEAMNIMQKIVRRNAKPIIIIEADTDDTTKMEEIKSKYQSLIENDEAMIVPKDSIKLLDFASKLNIDFGPWLTYLDKEFLIAEGVPEIILGAISNKDTESASKIVFVAWGQVVADKQSWFEEQWKAQIGFEIDLPEPPNMETMIAENAQKSGAMKANGGNKITDITPTGENK